MTAEPVLPPGFRFETQSEHIARDIQEGRFPEQSDRQIVPDPDYLAPSGDKVEAVAQAIYGVWDNGHRTWEATCEKLPGQADAFRAYARAAIAALTPQAKP